MLGLWATALGLAVAGLDPAGALIALAALASGTRPRLVLAFAGLVLIGTAALGTSLSLTLGRRVTDMDWTVLVPDDDLGAVLEILAGVALLVWAGVRLRRPRLQGPRPARRRSGAGLLVVGVLFTLGAVLDPTFLGLTVVAGRGEPWWQVAVAHALWALLSQAPLVALTVAVLTGRHARFTAWFGRWWERMRPRVARVLTLALVLAGAFLVLDASWLFATGDFLVPGPD
jgi:hypothetical protein